MADDGPVRFESTLVLAAVLTAVTGFVDAHVYLNVARVFVANQSGNVVLTGIDIGEAQWSTVIAHLVSIIMFAAGVAIGSAPVPRIAAHVVALKRLDGLEREDLIGRGEIAGFYVRVTEIVRLYIRDRFGVDAIDMTTSELTPAMRDARIAEDEAEVIVREGNLRFIVNLEDRIDTGLVNHLSKRIVIGSEHSNLFLLCLLLRF